MVLAYAQEGVDVAYVDIEAEDGVFLASALEAGQLGLELIVRHVMGLLLLLLWSAGVLLVVRRHIVVAC